MKFRKKKSISSNPLRISTSFPHLLFFSKPLRLQIPKKKTGKKINPTFSSIPRVLRLASFFPIAKHFPKQIPRESTSTSPNVVVGADVLVYTGVEPNQRQTQSLDQSKSQYLPLSVAHCIYSSSPKTISPYQKKSLSPCSPFAPKKNSISSSKRERHARSTLLLIVLSFRRSPHSPHVASPSDRQIEEKTLPNPRTLAREAFSFTSRKLI